MDGSVEGGGGWMNDGKVGSVKAGQTQCVGRYTVPVGAVGREDNMEVGTYIAEQEVGGDRGEGDELEGKIDEKVNSLRV